MLRIVREKAIWYNYVIYKNKNNIQNIHFFLLYSWCTNYFFLIYKVWMKKTCALYFTKNMHCIKHAYRKIFSSFFLNIITILFFFVCTKNFFFHYCNKQCRAKAMIFSISFRFVVIILMRRSIDALFDFFLNISFFFQSITMV